jgi:hypothetical protein
VGKRTIVICAGVLALALIGAGCGSDDEGEVTAAEISKAEFVKQADAACKRSEKQIQEDFAAYVKDHEDIQKPTEADYAELVDVILSPNVEQEVEDIRALGAPSGDEEEIEGLLAAREESVEVAEEDPEALISNGDRIFAKSSKLAEEYGLEVCGNR